MTKEDFENIMYNDQVAYEKLYIDYFKKFYNYGRKFTTETFLIEDSIQDTFLDIWAKRQKSLQINSINSYFFSIFRYTLFKKLKEGRKIVSSDEFDTDPEFSAEYILINQEADNELQVKLRAALQGLTSHQREAIFLRFYQSLSYEEVADILNISVKATYKLMARSLNVLKESMLLSIALLLKLLNSASFF
jgi:RNA polymerase sigma factor (sigma-70 family)